VWYSKDTDNQDISKFKEAVSVTFAHCSEQQDLVSKIDESIRVCLIVSDLAGHEMISAMIDGTLAHNKSIQYLIIVENGNDDAKNLEKKI